ncbi:protein DETOXIFICATION 46, chloroplastic-like [Primulina tabacum]|uniref:protein DETOXIFICATION 46, chloroplastic-like n=1 Tax=Primulina tabacum TaxID=48773 RepID=UPI003F59B510
MVTGLILGAIGTLVPWMFPKIFSSDPEVVQEMHKVLIPYFIALCVTPSTHRLEGFEYLWKNIEERGKDLYRGNIER